MTVVSAVWLAATRCSASATSARARRRASVAGLLLHLPHRPRELVPDEILRALEHGGLGLAERHPRDPLELLQRLSRASLELVLELLQVHLAVADPLLAPGQLDELLRRARPRAARCAPRPSRSRRAGPAPRPRRRPGAARRARAPRPVPRGGWSPPRARRRRRCASAPPRCGARPTSSTPAASTPWRPPPIPSPTISGDHREHVHSSRRVGHRPRRRRGCSHPALPRAGGDPVRWCVALGRHALLRRRASVARWSKRSVVGTRVTGSTGSERAQDAGKCRMKPAHRSARLSSSATTSLERAPPRSPSPRGNEPFVGCSPRATTIRAARSRSGSSAATRLARERLVDPVPPRSSRTSTSPAPRSASAARAAAAKRASSTRPARAAALERLAPSRRLGRRRAPAAAARVARVCSRRATAPQDDALGAMPRGARARASRARSRSSSTPGREPRLDGRLDAARCATGGRRARRRRAAPRRAAR